MRTSLALGCLLALAACAGHPPEPAPAPQAPAVAGGQSPAAPAPLPAPSAAALRRLAPEQSFGDLVQRIRALLRAGAGQSDDRCLFEAAEAPWTLRADLMPALDNTPEPPRRLSTLLADQLTPIRVLTPRGILGGGIGVTFASLTATRAQSAAAPVSVLALTEPGVFLRYGARDAYERADGPLPIDAVRARLQQVDPDADSTLVVSAEAGTPIARLVELLRTLPSEREVVLAVALPAGTELAKASEPATRAARCPNGLPEVDADLPLGDLALADIQPALAPLPTRAAQCIAQARGPAAAGGELELAIRVGADGKVAQACAMRDDLGDENTVSCVLSIVRELRFPPPQGGGPLDLQLPLRLLPAPQAPTHAFCHRG